MSSPPQINRFKGTDWEECNEFILSIRARALWEEKQRDATWMADFAAPNFSHKALLWHCRLPQEVRQDWFNLEIALIDRWGPSEDDDGPRIEPTAAAAPSLSQGGKFEDPLKSVLKVVVNGSNTYSYVKFPEGDTCTLTENIGEALRIRCSSLSGMTLLEGIDGSHPSREWLAVQCYNSDIDMTKGSTDFFYLVIVNSYTLQSSSESPTPFQLLTCSVSTNGEVLPLYTKSDSSNITLDVFCSRECLYFAVDPEAFSKRFPWGQKVKILIEEID